MSSKTEPNTDKAASFGTTHLQNKNSITHLIASDQGLLLPYSRKTTIQTISKNIIGTTTVSGRMIKCMVVDILNTKMEDHTPANLDEINHTVQEYLHGLMARNMKASGSTASKMGRVP